MKENLACRYILHLPASSGVSKGIRLKRTKQGSLTQAGKISFSVLLLCRKPNHSFSHVLPSWNGGVKFLRARRRQGDGGTKIKTNNNDFISISNSQMFASFLSLSCQMEICSLEWLWKETLVWVIVDMKVFVAFFWLSHSLHLSWRLLSLICVAWTRLEPSAMFVMRTGRCSFALPPLPTTSWDLLETSLTRMPLHGHRGAQWPSPHACERATF